MQLLFGAGAMFGMRTNLATGVATPVQFGQSSSNQIDFSFDVKDLRGQFLFPIAFGRANGKITGKCEFSQVKGQVLNDMFLGETLSVGQTMVALKEAASVPGAAPYTVTVANSATFLQDLGPVYANTGMPLTLVAAAPTAGQYAVSAAGVYTFAAADTAAPIWFAYEYSKTTGTTVAVTNLLEGDMPTWKGVFTTVFGGKQLTLTLNACVSNKLSMPQKAAEFSKVTLDFMAGADSYGNVGTLSLAE